MREDFLLLNPGPVPVAREVTKAMDEPMISRRSAEFGDVYDRVRDGLEYVFEHSTPDGSSTGATGEPLVLNGTGTMALEASVSNLVGESDEVVALVNGSFGQRLRRIGERYADVRAVETDWGEAFDLDRVRETVSDETALVTVVHNETSTGLLNQVGAIGEIAAEHDALFVVDGVSSIGGAAFRFDEWGVDVVATDPQKALASPPGISALYASEAAIEAFDGRNGPLYQNLEAYFDAAGDRATPFTAATPLVRALAVALERIRREGMGDRIQRHRRYAKAVREAMDAMGLDLVPAPADGAAFSPTMTAVELPAGVDADAFSRALADRGVSVGGGLGPFEGRAFRFGNMGELSPDEIVRGVYSVGRALEETGTDVDVVGGLEAAESVIR